ncbi:MAG TPA: hypothetical protein VE775_08740, partial [Pyrinomonadaceae bacterium]|nr:hypothetical protein [Pyrinomonadaceae bacterium]
QFTPGRLLLYPVSLRQLFALDLLSELTSTASIFAVPAVLAMAVGVGLARGRVGAALCVAAGACAFGIGLAKLLATSVGTLMQTKRARGEMLLAGVGALVAFAGVLFGQGAQMFARQHSFPAALRWTPPGAFASALADGLRPDGARAYWLALAVLFIAAALVTFITYAVARRAVLGAGGALRQRAARPTTKTDSSGLVGELPGWELPFVSTELATMLAKELRYARRNAQLRVMGLMPLVITLSFKLMNTRKGTAGAGGLFDSPYFAGSRAATSVFYVFMIMSALFCNQFGFDGAGLRTLILAPIPRRAILAGKNCALLVVAFVCAVAVLGFNELLFRDLTPQALAFAALCFILFAAEFVIVGNWLSVRYPKRLEFGKRMNTSGMASLLLMPLLVTVFVPPALAVYAGYRAQSLMVEYVILTLFALAAVALYLLHLGAQARAFTRRELAILDAVAGRDE